MTPCKIWQGGRSGPYGWTPDQRLAHRAAWEEAYGSIPPKMSVLHRCDVPLCVRPDHLFLAEARAKMSASHKGVPLSPEHKAAIAASVTRKDHRFASKK